MATPNEFSTEITTSRVSRRTPSNTAADMKARFAAAALIALSPAALGAETYSADVRTDNWFEMWINGETGADDSVPITTERSFNAESLEFEAERPFVIGLVAMGFRENDTGLEYIGTGRQQMGDGGVIAQIRNAAGETVFVSDANWQCHVIHTAPLDMACEDAANPVAGGGACAFGASDAPDGWDTAGYDASDWPQADVNTEAEVDPKMGYDEIT